MSPYISMEFQNERFVNEPEAKPENEEFEIKFRKHPIYDLYYGSKCGRFIHIRRGVINIGHKNNDGYLMCMIRAEGGKQKSYYVHRFIWECYNGLIPEGMEIDRINDIQDDNRLQNLQLVTRTENNKTAAENKIENL